MTSFIKIYALFILFICCLFVIEHFCEWLKGQSSSGGLLAFLTLLFGAGAGFAWQWAKHLVDSDNNGISDEAEEEKKHR